MKKAFFYIILILLFFNCAENTVGQIFKEAVYSEKAYLHSDRLIYIAGEDLFFNFYLMNGSGKPDVRSRYAYLILRNEESRAISEICLNLKNSMASGSIYLPDTLTTGSYQIVSFTNFMRNKGEETFCSNEILIVNRFDKDLNKLKLNGVVNQQRTFVDSTLIADKVKASLLLIPEKTKYVQRQKVRVGIKGVNISSVAHISISVHEKTPISGMDFFAPVPLGDTSKDSSSFVHLDEQFDLQTFQNSLRKVSVSKKEESHCLYYVETNGVILQGMVINSDNQQGIANATVFLSTPDTIANLQFTKTDNFGVFRFLIKQNYNGKSIFLRCMDYPKASIVLDDKFSLKSTFKPSKYVMNPRLLPYILKCQNIVNIQKTYQIKLSKEVSNQVASNKIPSRVYPPKVNTIVPSDFVDLPDFFEVSHEIIQSLKIRNKHETYTANMLNEKAHEFFDSPPLIFLDGVPIENIGQIITLGSDKIKKIETVSSERYFGGMFFKGILAVFSKNMEINNVHWASSYRSIQTITSNPVTFFYRPGFLNTDINNQHKPDFSQLLYWEALTVQVNEKKYIEFSASDDIGEFDIEANGILSDGTPVSAKAAIKIVPN